MGWRWHGLVRPVILVGLGPTLACGDDLPGGAESSSSTSGTPSGSSTGEPSASSSSGGLDDTTAGSSEGETTLGASATEPGSTSDGGDATTGSSTSAGSSDDTTSAGSSDGTTGEPVLEPSALEDVACMLRQQESLLVDVLANDFDPQGSPITIVDYTAASNEGGTVTLVGDLFVYVPPPGFWGPDRFRYTIADPEGHESIGVAHVMVWPGPIAASELALGDHGFAITPDVPFGRLGWAVSGGGDLDGDGLDDVVVSAPFSYGGMGRTYVVFGTPEPVSVELSAVAAGQGGYALQGDFANEYAGWSIDVLDDLDGDGVDDLAIGTGWANANGYRSGRVWVTFSQALGGTALLSQLVGTDGFVIDGAFPEDWAGWSVTGTGDMSGDGIGEILIGAPMAPDTLPGGGRAYVVFGKGDGQPVALGEVLTGAGGGFAMIGQAGDHVGLSTAALGDLDGDGLPELAVGSETAAGGAGRAYVVHGKPGSTAVSLASVMNGINGYAVEGSAPGIALGRSVDGLGDLDGDGLPELIVAAPGPELAGDAAVHVLFGANTSSMVLGVPPPGQGTTVGGVLWGDNVGWSVASLPDWNGDGLTDLALGAPAAGGDFGPGAVYVVFGRPDMSAIDLEEIAEGRGGFVIVGEDWDDDFGWRVSSAGDVDGDGSTDLLVGAPQAEPLGSFSGRAYV
jgi:hypothetical protein